MPRGGGEAGAPGKGAGGGGGGGGVPPLLPPPLLLLPRAAEAASFFFVPLLSNGMEKEQGWVGHRTQAMVFK